MRSKTTAEPAFSRKRGRPPRHGDTQRDTRETLLRAGMELLSCQGFGPTGLELIVRRAAVPKGSFYHFFQSKEDFGLAVLTAYDAYFVKRLDRLLIESPQPALDRLALFMDDAQARMLKDDFKRGCLVGNLGQEVTTLPDSFRDRLEDVLEGWQRRVATCIDLAGEDATAVAGVGSSELAALFWNSWEGAVLRARLRRSVDPMRLFSRHFLSILRGPRPSH